MFLPLLAVTTAHGAAFVLESTELGRLSRAVRAARNADATRVVPMTPLRVCVELERTDPKLVLRLSRRLGHSPEPRDNCDVAWFPLGLGWYALLIEPPADTLEDALGAVALPYQDVRRSTVAGQPIRLCTSRAAVQDPLALADELETHGVVVRAVYEVGACERG